MNEKGLSRREFLKGAAVLSGAAFLDACRGLDKKNIESLPTATIEQIKNTPEKFLGVETLCTSGYVFDLGEKHVSDAYTGPVSRYNWMTVKSVYGKHLYQVSNNSDMSGEVLNAVSETKLINFDTSGTESKANLDTNELHRGFPEATKGINYSIIGRILKEQDEKGKALYVFQIARLEPKEILK